jgi:NhaP-type Na+/H+ and K+/H+ antiporter
MVKKQKETDSAYFLKLVLYLILGTLWIKVSDGQSWQVPIPIGFLLGLLLTTHEHFQIDRKIEYAVLLVAMLVGFWAPIGLYINI